MSLKFNEIQIMFISAIIIGLCMFGIFQAPLASNYLPHLTVDNYTIINQIEVQNSSSDTFSKKTLHATLSEVNVGQASGLLVLLKLFTVPAAYPYGSLYYGGNNQFVPHAAYQNQMTPQPGYSNQVTTKFRHPYHHHHTTWPMTGHQHGYFRNGR